MNRIRRLIIGPPRNVIDPEIFLFIYTVTMVIMVVTGGKGTLLGPVVGGLIFGFLPVIVRSFARPEVQWILYGLFMILIVFVLPQGIVPAVERRLAAWGGGGRTRVRRLPTPDDVADAIVFLASDRARSITGQTLDVNAGRWMA